jgi:acetate kinase
MQQGSTKLKVTQRDAVVFTAGVASYPVIRKALTSVYALFVGIKLKAEERAAQKSA